MGKPPWIYRFIQEKGAFDTPRWTGPLRLSDLQVELNSLKDPLLITEGEALAQLRTSGIELRSFNASVAESVPIQAQGDYDWDNSLYHLNLQSQGVRWQRLKEAFNEELAEALPAEALPEKISGQTELNIRLRSTPQLSHPQLEVEAIQERTEITFKDSPDPLILEPGRLYLSPEGTLSSEGLEGHWGPVNFQLTADAYLPYWNLTQQEPTYNARLVVNELPIASFRDQRAFYEQLTQQKLPELWTTEGSLDLVAELTEAKQQAIVQFNNAGFYIKRSKAPIHSINGVLAVDLKSMRAELESGFQLHYGNSAIRLSELWISQEEGDLRAEAQGTSHFTSLELNNWIGNNIYFQPTQYPWDLDAYWHLLAIAPEGRLDHPESKAHLDLASMLLSQTAPEVEAKRLLKAAKAAEQEELQNRETSSNSTPGAGQTETSDNTPLDSSAMESLRRFEPQAPHSLMESEPFSEEIVLKSRIAEALSADSALRPSFVLSEDLLAPKVQLILADPGPARMSLQAESPLSGQATSKRIEQVLEALEETSSSPSLLSKEEESPSTKGLEESTPKLPDSEEKQENKEPIIVVSEYQLEPFHQPIASFHAQADWKDSKLTLHNSNIQLVGRAEPLNLEAVIEPFSSVSREALPELVTTNTNEAESSPPKLQQTSQTKPNQPDSIPATQLQLRAWLDEPLQLPSLEPYTRKDIYHFQSGTVNTDTRILAFWPYTEKSESGKTPWDLQVLGFLKLAGISNQRLGLYQLDGGFDLEGDEVTLRLEQFEIPGTQLQLTAKAPKLQQYPLEFQNPEIEGSSFYVEGFQEFLGLLSEESLSPITDGRPPSERWLATSPGSFTFRVSKRRGRV